MISGTVTIKNPNWAIDISKAISDGSLIGISGGVTELVNVAKQNVKDHARYPEGPLEDSVQVTGFSMSATGIEVLISADAGHAKAFEKGTSPHFVPASIADHRIVEGKYPHIKPVYTTVSGGGSGDAYSIPDEDPSYGSGGSTRTIIGYMAWGNSHPFMEDAFNTTRGYIVTEVNNGIRDEISKV